MTTSSRTARRRLGIIGLVVLPVALLGILLAGLWDPVSRLDGVRAAVVNLDEPVTVDGQLAPLGRQLAAELVGSDEALRLAWEITDEASAAAGLRDGTYTAAVTIPPDFSAAATSFAATDGTPRRAVVEVTTATPSRDVDDIVARAVTARATELLGSQLTTTYVENVLIGFTTLATELGDAADGAGQLADGVQELADGTTELAAGADAFTSGVDGLADGASALSGGAHALLSGTGELSGGARRLASGATELADGTSRLADGTRASARGARQLSSGARDLAQGTGELAGGAGDLADGLEEYTDGVGALAAGATQLATGAEEVATGAQGLATGTEQLADGAEQLAGGLDQLRDGAAGSAGEARRVVDGAAAVAEGLGQVVAGLEAQRAALDCATAAPADPATCASLDAQLDALAPLTDAAGAVAAGTSELVGAPATATAPPTGLHLLTAGIAALAGQAEDGTGAAGLAAGLRGLVTGADELAGGARELATGAGALAAGTEQLTEGASELHGGARALASGTSALSAGAGTLADGTGGLADGLRELRDGSREVSNGTRGLATGAGGLAEGAGRLAGGTQDLAQGTGELADGATRLAEGASELGAGIEQATGGVGSLADGARGLATGLGRAVDQIPSYDDEAARGQLAEVVAAPLTTEVGDPTPGTPAVLAVLALWLGALTTFLVLPAAPTRVLGSTRSSARLALRGLQVPAALAVAQGAVVGLVVGRAVGVGAGTQLGLVAAAVLVALTFAAANQAAVTLLGNVGRAAALVTGVVLLATAVVATVPSGLLTARALLPVGPAVDLLAGVQNATGGLGGAFVALLSWAALSLAAAVLGVARSRRVLARAVARGRRASAVRGGPAPTSA